MFIKDFSEKKIFLKKVSRRQQKHVTLPSMQRVNAKTKKHVIYLSSAAVQGLSGSKSYSIGFRGINSSIFRHLSVTCQ